MPKRRLRILPYRGAKNYGFYIDGLKVNGKRKRLFFHTEKEALVELKRLERQLRIEGEQGAGISADLRIDAAQAAKRLAPFGKSLRDAANFYAEHLERIDASVHVSVVGHDYCTSQERAGLSEKHCRDIRQRLGCFVKDFGARKIRTLTVTEIENWLHDLSLSPQSINNYRAVLSSFFEYARRRDMVEKNPVSAIPKRKLPNKPPEIFTPLSLASVLLAAPFDLLPALAIQAFAGLRTAEVRRLDWSEVDLARGYITVTAAKAKSAQRRLIPIAPNLADWLRSYQGQSGPVAPKIYHYAIELLLRAMPNPPKWPKNGLRHSFASYYLAEHQNAAELALHLGHTSTELIFANYRELVMPLAAHEYWRISPATPRNVVAMAKAAV